MNLVYALLEWPGDSVNKFQEEELRAEKQGSDALQHACKGAQGREAESNALARQQGERARRAEHIIENLTADLEMLR